MTSAGGRGRVVVVGGGLAGITAALACADAGCSVTLLEAKPRLGGLTYSFRRGDLNIDNGQHVFLRCCTAYRALLDRLGVSAQTVLQPRLDIPVVSSRDGRRARLRRNALPAPLHLARSLLAYRPLTVRARLRAARAVLALRGVDRTDPATDRRAFGDWLRAHGQDADTVEALWDLIGVATLNAHADDASLALAAMVFQVGLLEEAGAADLGWSRVPLGRLHGEAALARLAEAGVVVRTTTKVTRLERVGDGWRIATRRGGPDVGRGAGTGRDDATSGDAIRVDAIRGDVVADQVILAVPPAAAEALLPPGAVAAEPGWAARLGAAPIVNVHVVVSERVMAEPFLAVVGSPVQWVFDRTDAAGLASGQYLAVSVSAADPYIDAPVARLREVFWPELVRVVPDIATADLIDFFVTRERAATFRPAPGQAALRPPARTYAPGLFLAGAWTDTGWPATMEGAVRSGQAAARAVLGEGAGHLNGPGPSVGEPPTGLVLGGRGSPGGRGVMV
ncbi:MAG: FAD-dependent oxidoreductase [Micromonosporaceae bacterium]|nr:FAD-dependent oxidoreductase [Micromonosporaceae bacterium]